MGSLVDADRLEAWSVDDLDDLPDELDRRRVEILDGSLVVSPPPGLEHEFVIARLRNVLHAAAPSEAEVLGSPGIQLATSLRVPDLVVAPNSVRSGAGKFLRPDDVLLLVEVVSPGSITTDRITKPAQYAAAGIPAFWRVETDPLSLTAYRLEPGHSAYTEVGTWQAGEVVRLSEPFPVEIDLAAVAR